jgi:glutathione reductase (NADPH)
MPFDYDLFVIGGGSGGVRAARVAASEAGAKVGLAEEDRYGGTCVIRGCVPKKLMVFASDVAHFLPEAEGYGWTFAEAKFDWTVFHQKMNKELDRLEAVYRGLLERSGVHTFDARARIVEAHTVELSNGDRITAQTILVAVGGTPSLPKIEGIDHAVTSNDMFHFDRLPGSILIVGGGYIASEFAGIMNSLGVKTTQYYRGEQILRGFDNEARDLVASEMVKRGVDLRCGLNVEKIEKIDSGLLVTDTNDATQVYDTVMYATGRSANTDNLIDPDVGVELGAKGEIVVGEYSQSTVASIFALGDVTDRVSLTPVAIHEAMAFIATVFRGQPTAVDHALIPTAIFTQPEMGTIGLSEEEASALGPVEVYVANFRAMRQSFAGSDDKSLLKLVVCVNTSKVLGCHIVVPQAGEMIQLLGIAIKMGATKEDFDRTMAVHPTIAEELVTMREPTRKT